MPMYRRRSRAALRPRRQASTARRMRWAVVTGFNSLQPGQYLTFDLLSPIQPASGVSDLIYQSMTMPTLIAVMGHFTIAANDPIMVPGLTQAAVAEYAWGLYKDVDIASQATALPAYSAGYSNSWMHHRVGNLATAAIVSQSTAGAAFSATLGNNDQTYRRYDLNLRRYKRKLDSFNDTLVLSVENPSSSTMGFGFYFYFRFLLLE